MDPNGDAMVMCIDAIKKPMSFNDQKPTTEVWQTEAMYLNLSVEGDAMLEKHMKGTIKVPTKRQNDKTTRISWFFSQALSPEVKFLLDLLTEEVVFFSYQHFDVRFLLTIWSVDLVAWIILIVESLNKQDKPKKIQQLSSLNDFEGSRC